MTVGEAILLRLINEWPSSLRFTMMELEVFESKGGWNENIGSLFFPSGHGNESYNLIGS